MRPVRPFLVRTVGALALGALVVANVGLIVLNVSSRGWFSDQNADESAGVAPSSSAEESAPSLVLADEDDPWPGGRGPVPDGPPASRWVVVGPDGGALIVGSAPSWGLVEELVDVVAGRLGRDASSIVVDVDWHPEASPGLDDVDVELASSLHYGRGAIELPAGSEDVLASIRSLLAGDPALYVVLVGEVPSEGSGEEAAAVALARVTAVADELAAAGIDRARVVTTVAEARPELAELLGDQDAGQGGRVAIRIGNLLAAVASST